MEKIKQAYEEILGVIKKHREVCVYDIEDMERSAKLHLLGVELQNVHGFNINPRNIHSLDWNGLGSYRHIGWFGGKYKRTISWPDDGRQPEDEMLLVIGFPTGAYIFGDDYPEVLFQKFFLELKTYKPKYTDSANKKLYFSLENAAEVFNRFDGILNKYQELNKKDSRERKIAKLQKELKELEVKP